MTTERERAAQFGSPSQPEDSAVVRLTISKPAPYHAETCSGTLVAPNVLLTTLDCVSVSNRLSGYRCGSDGSVLMPDNGGAWLGPPGSGDAVSVWRPTNRKEELARGAAIFGPATTSLCADNIAVVVLDRDVTSASLPLRVARDERRGELLTLVGFEAFDHGKDDLGRRPHAQVLAVGPDDLSAGTPDFPVRAFAVGEGPCADDTGTPAISEETGAVVGIFSRSIVEACDTEEAVNLYTKVAPYSSILERAFESAGRVPVSEASRASSSQPNDGCSLVTGRAGEGPLTWTLAAAASLLGTVWRRLVRNREIISS